MRQFALQRVRDTRVFSRRRQAARIELMKLATPRLRRLLSLASDWAADCTCADAAPASAAPSPITRWWECRN